MVHVLVRILASRKSCLRTRSSRRRGVATTPSPLIGGQFDPGLPGCPAGLSEDSGIANERNDAVAEEQMGGRSTLRTPPKCRQAARSSTQPAPGFAH
jgi:hypothetical protein